MLDRKFGVTKGPISGFIYTIPLYVGLPLLPILGKITDKIGRRGEANVLSGIIAVFSFSWFLWVPCEDHNCNPVLYIIPLILSGIGLSFFNCFVWPAIALSVKRE